MQAVHRAWHHQFRDLRQATEAAADAVTLAEAAGDRAVLARALFQAAYAAIRVGAPDDAATGIGRGRVLFAQLDDARGVWLCDVLDAMRLRLDGEAEHSIAVLERLAETCPIDAAPVDLFVLHVGLALGYRFASRLEPALKWHFQAVDTARSTQDPLLVASTLCNLGGYHCDLHNHDEGCRLLEEGLALASRCDADRTTIIIALNLSQAYGTLGRHDDALRLADTYLTDARYVRSIGAEEPMVPLALALIYANAGRVGDAARAFDAVQARLVDQARRAGTSQVFRAYVETRIALVCGDPARAARVATTALGEVDVESVDSPFDLMQLHAAAATACELGDDHRRALFHERSRAAIRERLAQLAARAATVSQTIRHELAVTRADRDRVVGLHTALAREHERLAAANAALTVQIAENLRLHDELKEQNHRDALTGVHNRRYLYERGPPVLEAAIANAVPLCLVMIDLDHFKRLNDRYGHMVGDRVLVALGRLLRDRLREQDIVCRVGGEEFAMLLPATSLATARDRLESLLAACRQLHAAVGQEDLPPDLTFSAGVAEAPRQGTSVDALMIAADRLLYKAKADGRARVETGPALPSGTGLPAAREPVDHGARGDETEDRGHRHH